MEASIVSVKGFAGEDYERARYYHEDEKFLLAYEYFGDIQK